MSAENLRRSSRRTLVGLVASWAVLLSAFALTSQPAQAATAVPVMGRPVVTAADLVGWYRSTGKTSKATESMDLLAGYFISEGNDEGVAGDIAFAQSIVETGYFSFSVRVPPTFNNFSGLGAVDSGSSAESFPDARTGVRAQIQHLRAYADPIVTEATLAHPLVDTRFAKVSPKGRAPDWNQFGAGNWATDPLYASKVLGIHSQIVDWARHHGASRFFPFAKPADMARQAFRDLLFREPTNDELFWWETVLKQGSMTPEAVMAELVRGEGADTAAPVIRLYYAGLARSTDRGGLVYWSRQRKAGMDLDRLATMLISSSEFRTRFGDATDAAYVDLLYRNVLGRSADSAGSQFWVGRLRSGVTNRAGLLVQFSESSENKREMSYIVEATHVFQGMLLVLPGAEGLGWWLQARSSGESLSALTYHALTDPRYTRRF